MIRSSSKGGATLCGFKIAIVARTISGMANHFIADIGGGSMAIVAYQHSALELAPPSALTFQSHLMEAVSGGLVTDHRRAVESYNAAPAQPPVSGFGGIQDSFVTAASNRSNAISASTGDGSNGAVTTSASALNSWSWK